MNEMDEARKQLRALYGENKRITDGHYDPSLAVKCINGIFVGRREENVISYKGIPFVGEQPVGKYRWKAPVYCRPDDGVYEAYYNAKSSCQNEAYRQKASLYFQGEDCLYLNIWKAEGESAGKKPVMVWIHGGAFENGGTADPLYECSHFVRENPDVVAVSIAYRISVFGFFHLSHLPDGKEYPDAQNLGLMDQMMALRWIHENIAGFGGDPDNVTVFGQSAGAAKEIDILQGCNKDEVNYFVFFKGVESYNAWGAAQKAKKLAQMTAEERTRTESFCADIRGESYESTSRLFDQIWFIAPLFRMIRKRSPKERSLTGTGPIH